MSIKENVERIKENIPEHITVLAATKTQPSEAIRQAVEAGVTFLGENYVQEAQKKHVFIQGILKRGAEFHLIGPLQKSKINRALGLFDVIQTVDSYELAKAIDKRAQKPARILIQVNIGRESQKSGCAPEETEELARRVKGLDNLRLEGLMAMTPYAEEPEASRPYFREMRELFDLINKRTMGGEMKTLSMGLSHDYKMAIEEGSTMVRLGSAIFGPRS